MAVSNEMKILHHPQLDTALMVEETIKEHSEYKKKIRREVLNKKSVNDVMDLTRYYICEY